LNTALSGIKFFLIVLNNTDFSILFVSVKPYETNIQVTTLVILFYLHKTIFPFGGKTSASIFDDIRNVILKNKFQMDANTEVRWRV